MAVNPTSVNHFIEQKRSTDVWFDDGNCVLQAEDTVFKVYGGILQKHSLLFQAMLSLPQTAQTESEQTMYENCPLIPLVGDTARDAGYFLKALFDLQFYADVTKIKDIAVVLGVVNMALKYDADILLRRSLPAFTALYPATLPKWDIRSQRRQYAPFVKAYGRALPYVVIEVAKKTGSEILLPSAMLECCSYSISDIIDGLPTPTGGAVYLDRDSQRAILQARSRLSHEAHMAKMKIVHGDEITSAYAAYQRTRRPSAVVQAHFTTLEKWAEETDGPDNWVDPLAAASTWPAGACHSVVAWNPAHDIVKKLEGQRGPVWRNLPTVFGLQKWDKLRRVWVH
ncbi:hypothetical protein BC835DRAFT_414455 [Cytidiella melzeri]|nr:hypothetical protein BC835DRAFT_414455 [Cytidiella melzeri]